MKNFLFLVLIASCSTAWAEPGSNLDASTLDGGATLTFSKNVNVPAGMSDQLSNGAIVQNANSSPQAPFCNLYAQDTTGKAINFDSEIAANSVVTLISAQQQYSSIQGANGCDYTSPDYPDHATYSKLYFKTASGNLLLFQCQSNVQIAYENHCWSGETEQYSTTRSVSIGDFKQILSGIATLTLAPPHNL